MVEGFFTRDLGVNTIASGPHSGMSLHPIGFLRPVAVVGGVGHAQALADDYAQADERSPRLAPVAIADIPKRSGRGEPPEGVVAVFIVDHPGFSDGGQDGRGCVFFATDRDDTLVNGYLVAPAGSGLTSELGTFDEAFLVEHAGRVAGIAPGRFTFDDAIGFGDAAGEDNDIEACWDALAEASGAGGRR